MTLQHRGLTPQQSWPLGSDKLGSGEQRKRRAFHRRLWLSCSCPQPYLLSGADDNQVKIWDYQTKACVQTLDGHTHNVAAVVFHPR